jgi:dihydrofolate reductase
VTTGPGPGGQQARRWTQCSGCCAASRSSNPAARLGWPNSTLLHGDVPAAVADLKERSGTNLVIMGSGVLIGSLMAADLIDEYLLMIAPLVLGAGRRLFAGGTQASLRLVDSGATNRGVLIATYGPARG